MLCIRSKGWNCSDLENAFIFIKEQWDPMLLVQYTRGNCFLLITMHHVNQLYYVISKRIKSSGSSETEMPSNVWLGNSPPNALR